MDSEIAISIIAGASAIGGAFISSIFSYFKELSNKSHHRKVLLREKFEEMSYMIISAQEWIGNVINAKDISELNTMPPVDSRRAVVLAHIYFPKMREPTQNLLNAAVEFQHMLIDNHEFVHGKSVGVQAAHKNAAAYKSAAESYFNAIAMIDKATIKYASRYSKA
ncbi:hypothetical protein [Marinobacterium aestuarii]|nr:hypothetical protein [Marinobacterium aestuarii]